MNWWDQPEVQAYLNQPQPQGPVPVGKPQIAPGADPKDPLTQLAAQQSQSFNQDLLQQLADQYNTMGEEGPQQRRRPGYDLYNQVR